MCHTQDIMSKEKKNETSDDDDGAMRCNDKKQRSLQSFCSAPKKQTSKKLGTITFFSSVAMPSCTQGQTSHITHARYNLNSSPAAADTKGNAARHPSGKKKVRFADSCNQKGATSCTTKTKNTKEDVEYPPNISVDDNISTRTLAETCRRQPMFVDSCRTDRIKSIIHGTTQRRTTTTNTIRMKAILLSAFANLVLIVMLRILQEKPNKMAGYLMHSSSRQLETFFMERTNRSLPEMQEQ